MTPHRLSFLQEQEKKMAEIKKVEQELFKPVVQKQKVPVGKEEANIFFPCSILFFCEGVDPKSIVCEFFKKGLCDKGAKCKYSHNVADERKNEKIDLYTDLRFADKEKDTMENWDQAKLESVINEKSIEEEKINKNLKTQIVRLRKKP